MGRKEGTGFMYEFTSRIRYSETGPDARLSLSGLVDYFQDCCVFHSVSIGRGPDVWKKEHYGWMITSWQIVIDSYPKLNDLVTTRTWAYRFHAFEGDRNHTMKNEKGSVLSYANSRWVFYDMELGRPVRVPKVEIEGYGVEPELEMEKGPLHIHLPSENVTTRHPFKVRATNIDTNGHVNNEQYIMMALAYLPANIRTRELRVEYLHQARLGDTLLPKVAIEEYNYTVWLENEEGLPCAVMRFMV